MAYLQSSLRIIVVFIVFSRSIPDSISYATCDSELRVKDLCYYSRHCDRNCMGDIKPSDEASLSVTCSSNTNVSVAWNAPVGAVVNLGYTCYWAENNTQITKFPVVFEESSDFNNYARNLTISALIPGVYCVFFGCYELPVSQACFQPFGVNHTCVGGISSDSTDKSSSSITTLPGISSATHSSVSSTLPSVSTTQSEESILSTVSTSTATSTATPPHGGLDTTTYVIPVVLVFVAIVSTTALVFSCFTFYRWRSSRSKADYNYDRQLNQLNRDDKEASLISSLFIFSADYSIVTGSTLTVFNPLVYNENTSTYLLKEQLTDSGYAKMEDGNDNISVSTEKADDEPKFVAGDQDGDDSSECFCKETHVDFSPTDPCNESAPRVFHLDLSGSGADSHHDRTESLSSGYLTTVDPMSPFPNTSGSSFRTSSSLALSSHNHLKRSPVLSLPYGASYTKTSNADSISPATTQLPTTNHYAVESDRSHCLRLPSQTVSSMSDYIHPEQYSDGSLVNECVVQDTVSLPDHDLHKVEHGIEQDKTNRVRAQPQTALSSDYIRDIEGTQSHFFANHQKEMDDISFHSLECEEENPTLFSKSSPALFEECQVYSCSGYAKRACAAEGDYLQSNSYQSSTAIIASSPLPHTSDPDSISLHYCEEVYHSEGEDYPTSHPAPCAHTVVNLPSPISTCIPIETDYIPLPNSPTFTSATADVVLEYDIDEFGVGDACYQVSDYADSTRQLSTACNSSRSPSPLSMYSLASEPDHGLHKTNSTPEFT